jgi:aminopeptidase N
MPTPLPRFLALAALFAVAATPALAAPNPVPAGPSSATTPVAEAPNGVLPDLVEPTRYALELTIDPDGTAFSGRATIELALRRPAAAFWMHSHGLVATEVRLTPAGGEPIAGELRQVLPSGVSELTLAAEAPAGPATLVIAYQGELSDRLVGLFRTVQGGDAYALAKSESIEARRAFPGFDEPRFKTPFDITIVAPTGDEAISNGSVVERQDLGDGHTRWRFRTTRPLPTYLLSLAVGPFDVVEAPPIPANGVRDRPLPLRGIARRGKAGDLAFILSLTPRFVALLEEALGMPYPYEKLDIVAAPDWPSGATELAGAVTYREANVAVAGEPTPQRRRDLAGLHAHELAHSWFGNLVTPPWWEDLWLKESFAVWAEPVVLTEWEPAGGHDTDALVTALGAMDVDALASARAVQQPIARNEDIRNAYDKSVYSKGPAVLAMFEAYLGEERFRAALRRYVERHADGVVGSGQFFALLGELTGEPTITAALNGFLTRPGVPVVGVTSECAAGEPPALRLRLRRYRPLGSTIDAAAISPTPVVLAYGAAEGGAATARTVLDGAEGVLRLPAGTACPTWVLPNAGGSGYYRFGLDAAGWLALQERFPGLSAREALVVLDSAFAGFEAGEVTAAALLRLVELSAVSPHRHVVALPFARLAQLERHVVSDRAVVGTATGAAQAAFRDWLSAVYSRRLVELARATDDDSALLRNDLRWLLAAAAFDPVVRGDLAERAGRFVGAGAPREPQALTDDELPLALRVGVEEGGAPFVERLIEARSEIDDAYFREVSASTLGAVRDAALVPRILAYAMAEERPASETWRIVDALVANRWVGPQAWEWVRANLPAFLARVPERSRRAAPGLGRGACGEARAAEVEALFARHGALAPGHEQSLAQTAEALRLCGALAAAKADELAAALAAARR